MLTFMRYPVQVLTGKVNWRNHQEPINTVKNTNTGPRMSQYVTRCVSYADAEKETTLLCTMLGHSGLLASETVFSPST